jgi:hypothetical protein
LLLAGVQDRRHVSRTVVSTLLARSHSQMGATAGDSRHRQPGLIETLITQQRVRRDLGQFPRLRAPPGERGGHLLGRAPSRPLQVLPGGKGLPAGPSEASPCGLGGSGVGLCLPERGDDLA